MMRRQVLQAAGALLLSLLAQASPAFSDNGVQVSHSADSLYILRWTQGGPVDVFVSAEPDAKLSTMRLLARKDRRSTLQICIPDIKRPYFALRAADGSTYRTAERLLPLDGGSNFRDLGGYPGAGGKHVRWGVLYRSAALVKLSYADDDYLSTLRISAIVDLRSVDERQLSPTDWRAKPGAQYMAVDYPGDAFFARLRGYDSPQRELVTERLYADLPLLLKQQYKAMFHELLAHKVPLIVSCSAGQDRTGIAAGLILSALGTPRALIYEDYLLSTQDRKPANEMADVDLQEHAATNAEARFLIGYRNYVEKTRGHVDAVPRTKPLMDSKGRPLLQDAFESIEAQYGSVAQYMDRALGVNSKDIAKLRALYLD
jgi:protein-tyrosine phosphatase